MTVLVTGATGFVGRFLVAKLLAQGHEVIGLTRNPQQAQQAFPQVQRWVAWSTGPKWTLSPESLRGIDAVVNLAGESIGDKRWNREIKKQIYDSRILGTRAILDAVRLSENKPKVFISTSAVDYFGDRGNEPLPESALAGKGFLSEVCQDWEREGLTSVPGMRSAVFRFGMVLGRGGGALKKMLVPFRTGIGGRLGTGNQWVSWIHIEDLTQMIVQALSDSRYQGVFNAVSPEPVTNQEFTNVLAHTLHVPALMPVPLWALRLTVGEVAEILTSSHRVYPGRPLELGFTFHYSRLDEALREILEAKKAPAVAVVC